MSTHADKTVFLQTTVDDFATLMSYDQASSSWNSTVKGTADLIGLGSLTAGGDIRDAGNGTFGTWRIQQGFFRFVLNNDDIPYGSTIISAAIEIYGSVLTTSGGNFNLELYSYDWGSSVGPGDWQDDTELQALYDGGKLCGILNSADLTANGWNTFPARNETRNALQAALDARAAHFRLVMSTNKHRNSTKLSSDGLRLFQDYSNSSLRMVVTYESPDLSLGIGL